MIYYLSGGGPPWVPEQQLDDPGVCLSYWDNIVLRKGKTPNARLVKVLQARKQSKKEKTGVKGQKQKAEK